VQRTFDLMAEEVPWPDQQFDRVTLAYLVLPMAAPYTALRDRGRTEQDAVAAAFAARCSAQEDALLSPLAARSCQADPVGFPPGPRLPGSPAW